MCAVRPIQLSIFLHRAKHISFALYKSRVGYLRVDDVKVDFESVDHLALKAAQ